MRPEDIDWHQGVARLQRVRTFKGSKLDKLKTKVQRDVDLVPEALQALRTMKRYTFMKRDEEGREVDVFQHPVTGCAWHDTPPSFTGGMG
jgi:hypothetical protein